MSKKINAHAAIMLILSLIIVFVTITLPNASSSFSIGYIVGRALAPTLIPLAIVAIPAGIYKLIKKSSMPGFYILWWVLWFLFILLSTLGSRVQTPGVSEEISGIQKHKEGWNPRVFAAHSMGCQKGFMDSIFQNMIQRGDDPKTIPKEKLAKLESEVKITCNCISKVTAQTIEFAKYSKNPSEYNPQIIERTVKGGECPLPVLE